MASIKAELRRLKFLIAEKRSDIADILEAIIEGYQWNNKDVEHRFVYASLPDGTKLEYDTLTTEINYLSKGNSKWKRALNHDYTD